MGRKVGHSVEINVTPKQECDSVDQVERFRRVAQELGCDESEEAFDEKLKVIARHKPTKPLAKPEKPSSE